MDQSTAEVYLTKSSTLPFQLKLFNLSPGKLQNGFPKPDRSTKATTSQAPSTP